MADWVKYRVNRALMYHRTKLHNIYKVNKVQHMIIVQI